MHEASAEAVAHVDHFRKNYTHLIKWMGRSASILSDVGWSDRQHKSEWPSRSGTEKTEIARQRRDLGVVGTQIKEDRIRNIRTVVNHTQFGEQVRVAISLVLAAKRSRRDRDLQDDAAQLEAFAELGGEGHSGPCLEPPICNQCMMYRKLTFRDGIKCRVLCNCDRRRKRRRLVGKQSDRWGLFDSVQQVAETVHPKDANGHLLFIFKKVGITFCMRCGAFTGTHIKHLGKTCEGAPGTGKAVCLRRMSRGMHPTTGRLLDEPAIRVSVD